jgi:glutathione S-transferase
VTALKLYDYELDEQCYKVRLLLGLLGCAYEKIAVDVYPGGEQRSARFLRLNPLGALPILTDADMALSGAEAILAYLARKYDGARDWFPDEPETVGRIVQWLAFAGGDLSAASMARAQALFEIKARAPNVHRAARRAFRVMEDHMTRQQFADAFWFAGHAATIADIALFPAIALSRDIAVDHDEYPALRRWMGRVRTLPGFITMPGIPAYH